MSDHRVFRMFDDPQIWTKTSKKKHIFLTPDPDSRPSLVPPVQRSSSFSSKSCISVSLKKAIGSGTDLSDNASFFGKLKQILKQMSKIHYLY